MEKMDNSYNNVPPAGYPQQPAGYPAPPAGYPMPYPPQDNSAALRQEIARKQRKLIPFNIVVVLLCIVAIVSLLFLPLLTVKVDDASRIVSAFGLEEGEGSGSGSAEGESWQDSVSLEDALRGVKLDLSLSGMDLLRLGFSEAPEDVLLDQVGAMIAPSSDTLAANLAVVVGAASSELGLEELDVDVQPVIDSFSSLGEAQTEGEVDTAIDSIVNEVRAQVGEDAISESALEEVRDFIREQYDKTIANTPDGKFSTEAFVCVVISTALDLADEYLDEEQSDALEGLLRSVRAEEVLSPDAAGEQQTGGSSSSEGTGSTGSSGKVYTSYSELFGGLLERSGEDLLDEEQTQLVHTVFLAIAAAVIFFAFVWFVLLLFAFFHIFARNKRFLMWYVKIFGLLPCLIFGVAPLVLGAVLGGEIAAVLGMISTMAWVSGGCYVLLWLLSIFWAFPIKRKIRALDRQLYAGR